MGMLVIDDSEFKKELIRFGLLNETETKVVPINRGRSIGRTNIDSEVRKEIANEAITNGRTEEIANKFGISKSSVDAYKNGATSTASYNEPNRELKIANNDVKTSISSSARSALIGALDQIMPDRMIGVKLKDIASVAKDMSVIIKNMEEPSEQGNKVQVVVYQPRRRNEDEFDIITVNE